MTAAAKTADGQIEMLKCAKHAAAVKARAAAVAVGVISLKHLILTAPGRSTRATAHVDHDDADPPLRHAGSPRAHRSARSNQVLPTSHGPTLADSEPGDRRA